MGKYLIWDVSRIFDVTFLYKNLELFKYKKWKWAQKTFLIVEIFSKLTRYSRNISLFNKNTELFTLVVSNYNNNELKMEITLGTWQINNNSGYVPIPVRRNSNNYLNKHYEIPLAMGFESRTLAPNQYTESTVTIHPKSYYTADVWVFYAHVLGPNLSVY